MTLREYVAVARDRWRFVLAGLLLGLLAAGAVTYLTPREYASEITMMVSATTVSDDPSVLADGDTLSAGRVRTYVELMRSERLAADVVASLGLNTTAEELAERITVTSAPETVLLTAGVTADSPHGAIAIANAIGTAFVQNVAELEQPADRTRAPAVEAKVFEAPSAEAVMTAPRPVLYFALGVVLGVLAGFGGALFRNAFDTRIKTRGQLEDILGAPVIGVIGRDPKIVNSPLVIYGAPNTPPAEAFRQLRTNVSFIDVDREHKVILVTSATSGEGRSTTVSNLGLALAEAGHRVLILDADLRDPAIARYLRVDDTLGLTDVLVNRATVEQALQPSGPMLDVLPSGLLPPNPSELLGSNRMVNLLKYLRGRYDIILIDTAPLLPVTDAAVLAPHADGVLVLVRHGRTVVQEVQAAKDALDAVSARVVGAVLTMVPHTGSRAHARLKPRKRKRRSQGQPPVRRAPQSAAGPDERKPGPQGASSEQAPAQPAAQESAQASQDTVRRPATQGVPQPRPRSQSAPSEANGQVLERGGTPTP